MPGNTEKTSSTSNESSESGQIKRLLEERQQTHGNTWYIAGWIIQLALADEVSSVVKSHWGWTIHNWVLILSKLIRALHTPWEVDHWRDIEGYARLVREELQKQNPTQGVQDG